MRTASAVTPEARLRTFLADFDAATQRRIRSIRTALRKRFRRKK
jgi:hypothetical protein